MLRKLEAILSIFRWNNTVQSTRSTLSFSKPTTGPINIDLFQTTRYGQRSQTTIHLELFNLSGKRSELRTNSLKVLAHKSIKQIPNFKLSLTFNIFHVVRISDVKISRRRRNTRSLYWKAGRSKRTRIQYEQYCIISPILMNLENSSRSVNEQHRYSTFIITTLYISNK